MFIKNNYLDHGRMGKSVCGKWVVAFEVKDTCQNQYCKQSHYVWKMSWVQKNCPSILWQAKNGDIITTRS